MKNILLKSKFGFTKWCVALIAAGWMGMGNNSFAALNYFEDFTTAGVLTANGWTAFSGAGTNPLTASSPGLSYTGITNTGNAVSLVTSGEDAYKPTADSNTIGDLYASFLINVTAAQSTGDYFLSFYSKASSGGGYFGRVFIKAATGGYVLGLSKNSTTAVWDTATRSFNTTYLVVLKMNRLGVNSSTTTDDPTYLFVNPAISSSEPTPTVTGATGTGQADSYAGIDGVALRQGTAANTPTLKVGAIRYGSTWGDVIPSATATSPVVSSFSPASGKVGAAVTITGSNFGSSPTVKFNGVVASSPVVTGGTSIVVNVPTGATTGAISVEVAGETTGTSATSFTVLTPSITTLSPEAGLVGNTVTISGVNLATATSVTFTGASGAIAATPSAATDSSITITVPAGTVTGNVTVTTASGSSSARFRSLQALTLPYGPETFSSGVGSWFFYSAAGAKDWGLGTVGTPANSFITINGYDASVGAVAADDWAIIGPLDFSTANSFVAEFNIQKSYTNSSDDEIKLKVSRNYSGIGNPASSTWSDIPFTKPASVGSTTSSTVFTPVSVFLPSSLAGSSSVYIAFYFKPSATTSGATATWRVDDFEVTGSTKPLLSITAPLTVGENASSQTGVVSIASAISSNLNVTVTSSDATEILVGQIGGTVASSTVVTIPAGSTSANFKISPAVDGAIDGNQVVTLTAAVADNSYFIGTASVSVLDVDRPGTSLSSSGFTETFSSMGTAGPLPTGWYITSTAGSTYENITTDGWGNGTGSGGRTAAGILGYQHTGNTGTVTLTLSLQNNTGSPITALTVSFKGRAARLTETRKPVFSVDVAGQANPGLAYDTSYGDNYQMSGGTTGLNIPVGALFQISWASDRDLRNGGSSQQIGLSDVRVSTGFTPTAPSLGGVTVNPATIADTSAGFLGNVTSDGGSTVTESGFVYCLTSQSSTPTIGGAGVVKNVFPTPGIGILSVDVFSLLPSNSYTVRAYAINSIGTSYSAPTSFTTMAPNPEFTSGYTQNFNGFDSMTTIPAGWKCLSTGGANSYIASWPSTSSSAGFYGETNRPGVLGFTHTSTSSNNINTLTLVNRSGGTLTNLYVSYMGEVTQTNNERCPSWVVTSDDGNGTTEVTGLAYSTFDGTNATKTAQITGLSVANGATYSLSWTSDRGLVQTNGSSRRIGIGFVQIATTAAAIVSNAPVVSSPATLSATVGVPVSYQIAASESPTGFWAQNIPSGLTLNASNGLISGTLLSTNANASTMVVTAYNAAGVGNQNVALTVVASVKTTPTLTVAPSASAITVGQALSASTLTGGSASVAGAFAWTTPSTVPAVGTASYGVTFTPTDTVSYNTFTTTVSLTVNPAGSTFAGAYPGKIVTEVAPNGLSYLANYGFGGSEGIAPTLPVIDSSDPTKLKLIVVFRTDDSSISLGGQTSTDLALAGSWSTTGVSIVPSTDASPVPANTARKVISVDRSGSNRFLRATITK